VLLTDQTTVTLSNIEISVELFFVLLEKTRVTVGGSFSITEHIYNEDCIREHGMARNRPFCLERGWVVSPLALENIERMAPNSIGCYLKKLDLRNTGLISILPKLRVHKDCEIGMLWLSASEKEHVAEVLKQENPFCVGRVKIMWLWDYAVGVITKMSLKDCEIESLDLVAPRKEHVAEVLAQEKPFCVGRVSKMYFKNYAVGVITKMSLKDCEIERLVLGASEEAHVAAVLAQEKPFCVGRVKIMYLWVYAVSVITKMTIHEDNTMEDFVLNGYGGQLSRILEEGDNSIDLGRIRTGGLYVPEEVRRKLRYTLVDGEGKEVLEEVLEEERWTSRYALVDGEGKEVLGENISIRNKAVMFVVLFLAICFSYYHWL
ncbi:MAG: uncharacterized protein A8A55_3141, partial [Amphiamblys sp. WSBS2006]